MNEAGRHLILYDGVCGLCNRVNSMVLKRDQKELFHFAALQSPPSSEIMRQFQRDPATLDTFYVVQDYRSRSPRLLDKADAALFIATHLGGFWRLARVFGIIPKFVRNKAYDLVARYRYRVFGRYDACSVPNPEHRRRFIDL